MKPRRLRSWAAALLLIAVVPASVEAMTAGELSRSIRNANDASRALGAAAWNDDAEQALADRLDRLADEFHELAARGTSMPKTAEALIDLFESTRKRYTDVLEKMQADVIREDGDLEAVQDSSAWRQREVLAMRMLYQLNWVRYETAMRYERNTSKRKRLLIDARNGFTEFLASGDRELTIEALFGHGLTSKAMKEYDTAAKDFDRALEKQPDPDMVSRIRVALTETLLADERFDDALAQTRKLLDAHLDSETRSQALFLRGKALLLALGKQASHYGAAERGRMRTEAANVLERLYKSGSYWESKVIQLVDAGVQDPLAWASVPSNAFVTWLTADSLRRRADCDEAIKLYENLLAQKDYEKESYYGLGYCNFHEGRYTQAIDNLGAYLNVAGEGAAEAGNAAYLRFKSAESLYLRETPDTKQQADQRYLQLMLDFLKRAPDHRYAFEAWFRLGEWYRDHQQFLDCADAFAKVHDGGAFEIKGAFLSAQCYVQAVLAYGDDKEPPADLVRKAVAALDGFLERSKKFVADRPEGQADLMRPLEAKAVVMAAATVTRAGVGTMKDRLARLEGFETRFPDQQDLEPEVLSLRVVAYRTLGDLDGAGVQLRKLLALKGAEAYRHEPLKKLGIVYLKEASKREQEGDADGARRARRVALDIYDRLLADAETGRVHVDETSLEGMRTLVANLREQLDRPELKSPR